MIIHNPNLKKNNFHILISWNIFKFCIFDIFA